MRPAPSVILLTTLIGAGQGLFLALFTVQSYTLVGLLPPADLRAFYALGSAIALVFLVAGLVASFFHLGRPERAWRSAGQWRTSWLSREVIALPAFMGVVALYGLAHALAWTPRIAHGPNGVAVDATFVLGLLGTFVAFALFVCTAMIYACLRFIAEWHTPLTLINYALLGGASGFTLAAAYASQVAPRLVGFLSGWAIVFTALAAIGRVASLWRNRRLTPRSTIQSATGIKHPRITQIAQGFMGGSFNTREFFHRQGPRLMRSLKWIFIALAFVLPLALLAAGIASSSAPLLAGAFAVQYVGLLVERWFFFAQANHPQNLYYQAIS
ncbi:MAG: dimethyl sulfoxide reductase anchor subunit [Burkholderiales bacterium]|nr:dimethyl sulfoxide reductase anchor subunit [Burkholderiales bacterium]